MDTLAEGWAHHRAGRHPEAEDACRRALQADPQDADAWRLLGLACLRLGRPDEAVSSLREAARLRPDFAEALADLGLVLAVVGRLDEAADSLRRSLASAPDSADALANLGMVLAQLGRHDEAVANLRRAVALDPDHPRAVTALGQVLSALGRHAEMAEAFRPVVRLRPGRLDAQLRLGEAAVNLKLFEEASACFRAAMAMAPGSPEPHVGLGVALAGLGRSDEAVPSLRRALDLKPDLPGVHALLGHSLRALGRFDEAIDAYDRAIQLRPDDADAHHGRAFALDELRRLEEAVAAYDRVLGLKPDHAEAHHNRGVALGKLARYREAIASLDESLRLTPDYPEARRNRALALLTIGDFERGWEEFEWRWRCRELTMPVFPRPLWQGEPLDGRTIFIHEEQGLGDTIQFIRYASWVKSLGGRVVVECKRPLVSLLETCPGIDQVVPKGEPIPDFDTHCPILRLMGLYRTTIDNIPAPVPYLTPDPERVSYWKGRLESIPGFKVGIAWQGNPKHTRDRDRSFPLTCFEPLARIDGVRLINLQKGEGIDQLRALGGRFPVVDFGEEADPGLATIRDTPALMMGLDLVVLPDSSLAHLAGALGRPVWIALPKAPDWRWLLDREDSPWYPTARLFRQAERGRWDPVFDRIAAALAEAVSTRPAAGSRSGSSRSDRTGS